MRFPVWGKLAAVAGTTLVVGVVLARIGFLVDERIGYQQQAIHSVQQSHAGEQTVLGPWLQRRCSEQWVVHSGEGREQRSDTMRRDIVLQATAERLTAQTDIRSEARYRGLFKVNGYAARTTLQAQWSELDALQPRREHAGSTLTCEPATLLLATSDVRGLRSASLDVDGSALPVRPGTGHAIHARGLHAVLDGAAWPADGGVPTAPLRARLTVDLLGTAQLSLVPAAETTQWTVDADWPHPSFGGRFLPLEREVSEQGFHAQWVLSSLATSAPADVRRGAPTCGAPEHPAAAAPACLDTLSIAFVDPVNPYVLSDRALKYGLLFVLLTFTAVALTELLAGASIRRVHPVQYLLVGLALCLFFLLLLSLSEHLPFWIAYTSAAAACVGLLGVYGRHMLGGARGGTLFGAGMGLLYGLMYLLLQREQTALVIGSLGLFVALATVMLATRRVDWYRLRPADADAGSQSAACPGRA